MEYWISLVAELIYSFLYPQLPFLLLPTLFHLSEGRPSSATVLILIAGRDSSLMSAFPSVPAPHPYRTGLLRSRTGGLAQGSRMAAFAATPVWPDGVKAQTTP